MDNAKKSYDVVMSKFFNNYLFLRTNDELHQKKEFPNINKLFLISLRKYYSMLEKEQEQGD